jgi:hypothetical protein
MPKKIIENKSQYTAFADFELMGTQFKAGEVFTPPFNFKVDNEFMQFRSVERKGKTPRGVAFVYENGVLNGKKILTRSILPIE